MELSFSFLALSLLSLLLSASSGAHGRKDPAGEYRKEVMNYDQPLPGAIIKGLIHLDHQPSLPAAAGNHGVIDELVVVEIKEQVNKKEGKHFVKEFEPRPNISSYHGDEEEEHKYVKEFEPRPNISSYHDDKEEDHKYVKDFEPRPDVTSYHGGDEDDKKDAKKQSADDCMDHKKKPVAQKEEKGFSEDFEPRPNISMYHE